MRRPPAPKLCLTPGCGKLTHRALCIECERAQRNQIKAERQSRRAEQPLLRFDREADEQK